MAFIHNNLAVFTYEGFNISFIVEALNDSNVDDAGLFIFAAAYHTDCLFWYFEKGLQTFLPLFQTNLVRNIKKESAQTDILRL
ncbi:hypothetical protein GCM10010912_69810 [Paenibacillus albidus]|uniref:Uncharacterized protein n=1 Tax=Paenibacillus albidus TaxID=2041023 RepID=A0A917FZL3_9BACL|nr:hypothetical protein [Paenibacillus albidus]GGG15401.1 hypothetical protein GCM10010912_69810 [Paenibacillus albidus]